MRRQPGGDARSQMRNFCREAPRNARAVTCVPVGRNEPLRSELEAFVNAAFLRKHGAHVRSFMPTLLSWRDGGARLGVVGLRAAQEEPLYLENYLDSPIERTLAERAGRQGTTRPDRGNWSSRESQLPGCGAHRCRASALPARA